MANNTTIFAKPWFVATVVFGCFAIITPKIIIPMLSKLFTTTVSQDDTLDRPVKNEMRQQQRMMPNNEKIVSKPPNADSGSRTFLGFILPVYAIGIGVYMTYTLFKIYGNTNKKKPGDYVANDDEQLLNDLKYSNIKWDPTKNEFISRIKQRSDDLFDEEDTYSSLDRDYVEFLKRKRQNKASSKTKDMMYILETMKESLNNINKRLNEAEKIKDLKTALDESQTESLKIQLANTELQMSRLLSMVDTEAMQTVGSQAVSNAMHDNDDDDVASSIATTTDGPSRSQSTSSLNESSDEQTEFTIRKNKIKKHSKKEFISKKADVYSTDDEDEEDEVDDDDQHNTDEDEDSAHSNNIDHTTRTICSSMNNEASLVDLTSED